MGFLILNSDFFFSGLIFMVSPFLNRCLLLFRVTQGRSLSQWSLCERQEYTPDRWEVHRTHTHHPLTHTSGGNLGSNVHVFGLKGETGILKEPV